MSINRFSLVVMLTVCVVRASSSSAQTLSWDEPDQSGVTGYAVSIDGSRRDYGLAPVSATGACACSVPFPFTTGTHTIVVSAYGPGGEQPAPSVTVTLGSTTTPSPSPLAAPWAWIDIGQVGAGGSATTLGGAITVKGAGADIWGSADAFGYAYQPLSGDGAIVARVTGVQNTDSYAKAGVMWRQALTEGSPHVVLDIRPDGSLEFMTRSAAGAATTFLTGGAQPLPAWLKLSRSGTTVTGSASLDGSTWTTVGNATIAATTTWNAGLAVTSHVAGTLNTSTFDNVTVTASAGQPATTPVPAPWTDADVGATGAAGSASLKSPGVFAVSGSGADIWGTSDAFNYLSQPSGEDVQIVARVTAVQNTNAYAKAGIMLRASATAAAPHVVLDSRPDGSIEFMARAAAGGPTVYLAGAKVALPAWLKLVRTGATVAAYVSTNGSTWTNVGTTSTSMTGTARVGLAVTSHAAGVTNTSIFDNVSVSLPAFGTGAANVNGPAPTGPSTEAAAIAPKH